jgi:hypothetical protein
MKPTMSRLPPGPPLLGAIVLLAALSLAIAAGAAAVQFAQFDGVVKPAPADARRLGGYFSPPYKSGPPPSVIGEMLVRNAPAKLRAGCAATVAGWGAAARGSGRVTVRILAMVNGTAWFAYRCASHEPRFAGDYTEQLAAFNTTRKKIEFLKLSTADDRGDTLYHVGYSQTVKLHGAGNSAAFEVFAVTGNLGGGESRTAGAPSAQNRAEQYRETENRFVVVANSAPAAKVVLSLVTARHRPAGTNRKVAAGGEASGEYQAALQYEHDLAGHLTAIVAYARSSTASGPPRFTVTRFAWNRHKFRFTETAPEAGRKRHRPPAPQPWEPLPPVPR